MQSKNLTLLGDKFERTNKRGGTATFVKLAVMHDEKEDRVRVIFIDIFGAENLSVDAAGDIDHCLEVYDYDDAKVRVSNHTTDAGGGGTRRDLFLKLCEVD